MVLLTNYSKLMSKIRILYINETSNIAGAETWFLNFLSSLSSPDFEIYVLSTAGSFLDEVKKHKVNVLPYEFKFKDISSNKFIKYPLFLFYRIIDTFRIYSIVKDNNISMVHSLNSSGHLINGFLNLFYKSKTIWHVHSDLNNILYKFFSPLKMVFVSNIKAEITKNAFPSIININVIYNGIEIDKFPLQKKSAQIKTIGFVGRLMPEKGLDELLDAYAKLKKSNPELKLKIFGEEIYDSKRKGKYTSHLKNKAAILAQKLSIDSDKLDIGLEFCGHVFPQQSIYEQIDLLILPSYQEAFPMVILEAASSGVPVIASNVGGVSEFISEGKSGFMIPPKNSDKLAEKIDYVLKNPDIVKECVKNARKLVEEKFTAKINSDKFLTLYKELLNTK